MTVTHEAQTHVSLRGEEALRMTLLSEEVIAAAYEQALIVSGVLGLEDFRPASFEWHMLPIGHQALRFTDAAGRSICYDWVSQLCYEAAV